MVADHPAQGYQILGDEANLLRALGEPPIHQVPPHRSMASQHLDRFFDQILMHDWKQSKSNQMMITWSIVYRVSPSGKIFVFEQRDANRSPASMAIWSHLIPIHIVIGNHTGHGLHLTLKFRPFSLNITAVDLANDYFISNNYVMISMPQENSSKSAKEGPSMLMSLSSVLVGVLSHPNILLKQV